MQFKFESFLQVSYDDRSFARAENIMNGITVLRDIHLVIVSRVSFRLMFILSIYFRTNRNLYLYFLE